MSLFFHVGFINKNREVRRQAVAVAEALVQPNPRRSGPNATHTDDENIFGCISGQEEATKEAPHASAARVKT